MAEVILSLALVGALAVAAFIYAAVLLKDDPLIELDRVGDQVSDATVRSRLRSWMDEWSSLRDKLTFSRLSVRFFTRQSGKRKSVSRQGLQSKITEAVKSEPDCADFVGVVIEGVAPKRRGDANWKIKAIRFGGADRIICTKALAAAVERLQSDFRLVDDEKDATAQKPETLTPVTVQIPREDMTARGTVKWFNLKRGFGFIKADRGGNDVFVHISAVKKADYTSLVKGAKISYDVVTNRDKQRAENLRLGWTAHKAEEPNVQNVLAQPNIAPTTDPVPELMLEPDHASVRQSGAPDPFRNVYDCIATLRSVPSLVSDRTPISRATLQTAIAEAVRKTEPCCEPFIGVIVELAGSNSASDANWAIRGVRFGRADRRRASEALCKIVELMQRELILSDDHYTPDHNNTPTRAGRSDWVLPAGSK